MAPDVFDGEPDDVIDGSTEMVEELEMRTAEHEQRAEKLDAELNIVVANHAALQTELLQQHTKQELEDSAIAERKHERDAALAEAIRFRTALAIIDVGTGNFGSAIERLATAAGHHTAMATVRVERAIDEVAAPPLRVIVEPTRDGITHALLGLKLRLHRADVFRASGPASRQAACQSADALTRAATVVNWQNLEAPEDFEAMYATFSDLLDELFESESDTPRSEWQTWMHRHVTKFVEDLPPAIVVSEYYWRFRGGEDSGGFVPEVDPVDLQDAVEGSLDLDEPPARLSEPDDRRSRPPATRFPDRVTAYRGNPGRTGWMPGSPPTFSRIQWTLKRDGVEAFSAPLVCDRVVYVGYRGVSLESPSASVLAISAETGRVVRELSFGDRRRPKPKESYRPLGLAIEDHYLYLSTHTALHAIDLRTWTEAWRHELHNCATPVSIDGQVFVSGVRYNPGNLIERVLHALSGSTGRVLWSRRRSRFYQLPMYYATAAGVVAVAEEGTLSMLSAASGVEIWSIEYIPLSEVKSKSSQLSMSVIAGDEILVRGSDRSDSFRYSQFISNTSQSGIEKWRFTVDTSQFGFPSDIAIDSNGVYFCTGRKKGLNYPGESESHLWAVSLTGKLKWRTVVEGYATAPTVTNEAVWFGSDQGFVAAVDPVSGNEFWRADTKNAVYSSPLVADGRVLAVTSTRKIGIAPDDSDGTSTLISVGP